MQTASFPDLRKKSGNETTVISVLFSEEMLVVVTRLTKTTNQLNVVCCHAYIALGVSCLHICILARLNVL